MRRVKRNANLAWILIAAGWCGPLQAAARQRPSDATRGEDTPDEDTLGEDPSGPHTSQQDTSQEEGVVATPSLDPPVLLTFVEASYPAPALAQGREGEVELGIVIGADGAVIAVEVLRDPGDGFAEAARVAALQFRFRPAHRDGAPVGSRIAYTYRFTLPAAEAMPRRLDGGEKDEGPGKGGERDEGPGNGGEKDEGAGNGGEKDERLGDGGEKDERPGNDGKKEQRLGNDGVVDGPGSGERAGEDEAVISVRAHGRSVGDARRHSADAVHVIELDDDRRDVPDLGVVLERDGAVNVRRTGGLGNEASVTMGGLGGNRVPVFLDGVPLEWLGFAAGLANVPVSFIERIEIYRGVTPIRLGADALGGAIDVITDVDGRGLTGTVDYTGGSFDTHRLAAGVRYRSPTHGFFVRGSGYFDRAENDYVIDRKVADTRGREVSARVRRFHDAYQAGGGMVEVGWSGRPRLERLSLQLFGSEVDKEIQHRLMSAEVPFGEVRTERTTAGAVLRYRQAWGRSFHGEVVAGYTFLQGWLIDQAHCRYNWYGACVLERTTRGEIDARDYRQRMHRNVGYLRSQVRWSIHPHHELRLAVAPSFVARRSEDRRELMVDVYDPLSGRRNVFKLVTGLEYVASVWNARVEQVLAVKDYVMAVRADEPLPNETFRDLRRDEHHVGLVEALRVEVLPFLDLKGSYEWTVRMPEADELFGDGMFVFENLQLRAERSHNFNLGAWLATPKLVVGSIRARVDGFARLTRNQILLPGGGISFQNIDRSRSLGVDGELGWTSPGSWVDLRGQITWQRLENTSREGAFAVFRGDRLPNQPWLFGSVTAMVHWSDAAVRGDRISLGWVYRYVHGFYLAWESQGLAETKSTIDAQHLHALVASYGVVRRDRSIRASVQIENLGNRRNYDFFGIQKPGRSVFGSLSLSL